MWVLNIYPNTGSNIVGAENRRQAGSLGTAVEGGRDGELKEEKGGREKKRSAVGKKERKERLLI